MNESHHERRQALVFGASGFIGRWLVRELMSQGIEIVAAVRTAASGQQLQDWLAAHNADPARTVLVEFTRDGLELDPVDLESVTEVYNVAGAFRFGMTPEEARAANVDGSLRVVEFAAKLPRLGRLVHLSGYRVSSVELGAEPWSPARRSAVYTRLGAYEASKMESDALVRIRAAELAVPLTIANPSTVVGHSVTGESDQRIGLAATIRDLADGTLTAIPGGRDTFVPVVSVDYLVQFLTLLPVVPETAGAAYWILDDATPPLPDLLRLIGRHLEVPVPRLALPVWLIRRLPVRLTKADPETLSFLASDRYPSAPATELAQRHGLVFPPVEQVLTRWADHLLARQPVLDV